MKLISKKKAAELLGTSYRTIDRYLKGGKLTAYYPEGTKRSAKLSHKEVALIAAELHANIEKHRPDALKEDMPKIKRIEAPALKQVKKFVKKPTPDMLSSDGESILKHTTKYLEDKGLMESADPNTIMRYAFASQMKAKYTYLALQGEEVKYWLDIAKQFQAEIQHYEKELGLTPAALSKIKPMEKEDQAVDPMEALLNGN